MKTGKKKKISEHEAREAFVEAFSQARRAQFREEAGYAPATEESPVEASSVSEIR